MRDEAPCRRLCGVVGHRCAGAVDGHEGEREIGALEVGAEGTGVLGPADEQLDSLLSTSAALLHLDLRKSPQERSAEASVGNLHGRDAV